MPGFNIGGNAQREPSNVEKDPFRVHRWRIVNLGVGGTGGSSGSIFRPPTLALYAKSLTLPSFNVEEEVVIGASVKYKFAKLASFEDVVITFYDTIGIYDGILDWQQDVWDKTNGVRMAERYKRNAQFCLTDGQGRDTGTVFLLIGCWPKQVSHSALTYDSSELKLINLTLSYDWAEFDVHKTVSSGPSEPAGLSPGEKTRRAPESVTPEQARANNAASGRSETQLPVSIQRALNRPLSREAGLIRVK